MYRSYYKNVFKGFLYWAHAICSKWYIKEETQFLLNVLVKNEHKRTFLVNLVIDHNSKEEINGSHHYRNSKKIPWVLNIGRKIKKKKKFKKVNRDITFRPEKNLQSILYQNKPKLLSTSYPKVYQLDCLCNGRYIGKSKKMYWRVALNISKTA